jgi:t-SNARE complex subunit (syntaxin)
MSITDLVQDIQTLTPAQQESVFSFVYLLKHPDYLQTITAQSENIEPFATEREALDFINDYAGKIANETW